MGSFGLVGTSGVWPPGLASTYHPFRRSLSSNRWKITIFTVLELSSYPRIASYLCDAINCKYLMLESSFVQWDCKHINVHIDWGVRISLPQNHISSNFTFTKLLLLAVCGRCLWRKFPNKKWKFLCNFVPRPSLCLFLCFVSGTLSNVGYNLLKSTIILQVISVVWEIEKCFWLKVNLRDLRIL